MESARHEFPREPEERRTAGHGGGGEARAGPDRPAAGEEDPARGHARMIRAWIWRDFANIILGVWLIALPLTTGTREPAMLWSSLLSGAAVVVLGIATLSPRFDLARWGICLIGIWLLFAPLVFWTRSPAVFDTSILAGALLVAFSVLIPMMPGRAHHEVMSLPGPDTPPGWSYNPSGWLQRGPIIAMAFVGFFLSRYLAAYQLGHVAVPWDPFFGDGTRRVLDSEVSRAWPISDAGLGAVSYMLEALSGFMGGRNRWRTMPWMVLMFGFLVVPLGIVSIVLVILQPVAVGAWCTLCLITAVAMLIMIAPALDEVVAMLQFLRATRRAGKPVWRTFWVGGTVEGEASGVPAAKAAVVSSAAPSAPIWRQIVAAMDLDHVPWNMVLVTALGVWVMAAPSVLQSTGAAADSDHLAGALVVTFAVIAFGQIARPARFACIPLGLWLVAAPWLLPEDTPASRWNDVIAGALIVILSVRRGRIVDRFGGWSRRLV